MEGLGTLAVGDAVKAEFETGWLRGVVTEVIQKPRKIRVTFNPDAEDEQVVAFTQKQAVAELKRGATAFCPHAESGAVCSRHPLGYMWPWPTRGNHVATQQLQHARGGGSERGFCALVCPTAFSCDLESRTYTHCMAICTTPVLALSCVGCGSCTG